MIKDDAAYYNEQEMFRPSEKLKKLYIEYFVEALRNREREVAEDYIETMTALNMTHEEILRLSVELIFPLPQKPE